MRLSAMSSVLSAQEMSDTVVYSAETMLTAVTEVGKTRNFRWVLIYSVMYILCTVYCIVRVYI